MLNGELPFYQPIVVVSKLKFDASLLPNFTLHHSSYVRNDTLTSAALQIALTLDRASVGLYGAPRF